MARGENREGETEQKCKKRKARTSTKSEINKQREEMNKRKERDYSIGKGSRQSAR